MSSNSANMNIAERLAQRIKESELGALIDEDSLSEIAKKALEEAFFKPRHEGGYSNGKTLPPLIVEQAGEAFKTAIADAIKPLVATLIADPKFNKLILDAVMASIPEQAKAIGYGIASQGSMMATTQTLDYLRGTLGSRLGVPI